VRSRGGSRHDLPFLHHQGLLSSTHGLDALCGADLGRAVRPDPEAAGDAPRRSGTATRASCEEADARHYPPTFLPGRLGHRTPKA